jgi:hypothetical protein
LGLTRDEALAKCIEIGVPRVAAEAQTTETHRPPASAGGEVDARVARRWLEKIVAAEMDGVDLLCACAPCARLTSLLADAEREVLGGR